MIFFLDDFPGQFALEAGAIVFRWCTDEVERHDRFDYWREVRAKGLFGVTAELERERRADFFANSRCASSAAPASSS